MFNKNAMNPNAVMHAQAKMEEVINQFDVRTFSATEGDVTVTLYGNRKLKSVVADDSALVDTKNVESAFERVSEELEYQRNVKLVQIRNEVMKKYRVDIKSMVPDIASAVADLSARQAKAS
jgi:hypothetical protein